jgi:hypothetical protein
VPEPGPGRVRFLSEGWFELANRAAAAAGSLAEGEPFVLRQVVVTQGHGAVVYRVVLGPGGPAFLPGDGPHHASLRCDLDTARALAEGRLSAYRALEMGAVRLEGDPAAVSAQADRLAELGRALAGLSSQLDWG